MIFLSGCLIAKNEALEIGRCIESMKKVCDEIVVVDTGSCDETKTIAQSAGAKVYDFTWNNDFAAAKNFALSKAKGNWILFLDADEYLVDKISLKNILEKISNDIDVVLCCLQNVDSDYPERRMNSFLQIRIFRHDKKIYFTRSVHERLIKENSELKYIAAKEIIINHTGYSLNRIRQKFKRNKILLNKIPPSAENYHYLADCYFGLYEYKKAAEFYQKHIESGLELLTNESEVYFNLINTLFYLKDLDKIKEIIQLSRQKFPINPEFLFLQAKYFYWLEEYGKAKHTLYQAIDLYKKNKENITNNNFFSIEDQVFSYLAKIYLQEGDIFKAEKMALNSLEYNKCNEDALYVLFFLWHDKKILSIIKFLEERYGKNLASYMLVARQALYAGNERVFMYYQQQLKREFSVEFPEGQRLSLARQTNYQGILSKLQKDIEVAVLSMLAQGEINLEYQKYLPDIVYEFLLAYFSQENVLAKVEYSTYKLYLQPVAQTLSQNKLLEYVEFSKRFSIENQIETFSFLLDNGYYKASLLLAEELSKSSLDENLLYKIGQSYYYNDKLKESENIFTKLKEIGKKKNEVNSYLAWIEEKKK